jgi:2-dehydro-3-deoxygalactonokinase
MPETISLISCDWGTSGFRLRLLVGNAFPRVVAERVSSRGVGGFEPGSTRELRDFLSDEISRLFEREPEPLPVVLSGMVTSSIGWKELPYARLPFSLDGSEVITWCDVLQRPYGAHDLLFISGVRSDDEVMRGEECELIGIFSGAAANPVRGNVVALLPGTHSKAAVICDGRVVQFRTFLTGELFEIVCRHSILRHSVGPPLEAHVVPDTFFDAGVLRGAEQGSLASLFSVRGQALLKHVSPQNSRQYLSGLLIGDEVAAVRRFFPAPMPLLLCGKEPLQAAYGRALSLLGESSRLNGLSPGIADLAAALGHWSVFSRRSRQ